MDTPKIGAKCHMIVQNALYCTLYLVMDAAKLVVLIIIVEFLTASAI